MSSDHWGISFETEFMPFEGANNKFIHITFDKINDVLKNSPHFYEICLLQHILCFIIQRNYIKVFHDVANVDFELILSKLVPFFAQIVIEYMNSDDSDIRSILVDR